MKALVFQGKHSKQYIEQPMPIIQKTTDCIIKMLKTTICGTDLHILKGDVPTVADGRILGHEGIGIIEEIGSGVTKFKKGDLVIISCITSCGKCDSCKDKLYAHCSDGGWILGHLIDGTQAEYVRIPHADNSLHLLPEGIDKEGAVMLSDIFPTGFEIGVLNGEVKPGDVVAIIGAGPIGLAALLTAQFYSPSRIIMVDLDDNRLETAKKFGATDVINAKNIDPIVKIMETTNNKGVNVAIEAIGIPETFNVCQEIIQAGGYIANVGVHGKSVDFQLQKLWIKNITLRTGLVNTTTTPMLLKTVEATTLKPEQLVTHRFKLDDIMQAYEVFTHASQEKALKVIIEM